MVKNSQGQQPASPWIHIYGNFQTEKGIDTFVDLKQ